MDYIIKLCDEFQKCEIKVETDILQLVNTSISMKNEKMEIKKSIEKYVAPHIKKDERDTLTSEYAKELD